MRFFTSLLTLWATCLGVASGYSMPGGYERVMMYYSYLAECVETKNNPTKMATGCGKHPCSLDKYMEYVLPKTTPPTKVNIHSSSDPPDVEKTAKALNDANLTGAVVNGRVWAGAPNNWAEVLAKVGGYVARNVVNDAIPQNIRDGMTHSMKMVHAQRIEASATSWKVDGKTIVLKDTNPYGVQYKTIDAVKIKEQNPGWKFGPEFKAHIGDGHWNNIEALKDKLEEVKLMEGPKSCG